MCLLVPARAQAPNPAIWQVTLFDVNANVQQAERTLGVTATINATNVGGSPTRTLTVRLNSKASVKSVAVAGAPGTFRPGAEARGDLQRIEITLPAPATPGTSTSVTVNYTLPVETIQATFPVYLEPSGKPRVKDLVAFQDWFHQMGWVKEKLPMSRVVDLTFLE